MSIHESKKLNLLSRSLTGLALALAGCTANTQSTETSFTPQPTRTQEATPAVAISTATPAPTEIPPTQTPEPTATPEIDPTTPVLLDTVEITPGVTANLYTEYGSFYNGTIKFDRQFPHRMLSAIEGTGAVPGTITTFPMPRMDTNISPARADLINSLIRQPNAAGNLITYESVTVDLSNITIFQHSGENLEALPSFVTDNIVRFGGYAVSVNADPVKGGLRIDSFVLMDRNDLEKDEQTNARYHQANGFKNLIDYSGLFLRGIFYGWEKFNDSDFYSTNCRVSPELKSMDFCRGMLLLHLGGISDYGNPFMYYRAESEKGQMFETFILGYPPQP